MNTEGVLYEGIVWHDEDYALDAKGRLYQLRVDNWHSEPHYWHWITMGNEFDWELDANRMSGGPQLPLKRVVIAEEL